MSTNQIRSTGAVTRGALLGLLVLASSALGVGVQADVTARAGAVPTEVLVYEKADGVYAAGLDGSGQHLIASAAAFPLVSPDGSRVMFTDQTLGTKGRLGVVGIDGSGRRVLSESGRALAWQPDGQHVVVSVAIPSGGSSGLSILDPSADAMTAIAQSSAEFDALAAPDGTLVSDAQLSLGIARRLRRPDGSGLTQGPPTTAFSYPLAISRDGTSELTRLVTRPVETWPSPLLYEVHDPRTGHLRWTGQVLPSASFSYLNGGAFSDDATQYFLGVRFFEDDKFQYDYPVGIYRATVANHNATQLIAGADHPSVGGGSSPIDTNGAPPPVSAVVGEALPGRANLTWTAPGAADYAGVDVRYQIGNTAPADDSAGLDGGRVFIDQRTIDDLLPDTTYSFAVFSRDWFGNIGPAATATVITPHERPAVTLSAHARPFDLVYGQRSRVTVSLTRTYDGAPLAGATVTVSRRLWGRTTAPYTYLDTLHTDNHGLTSFVQTPSISYDYAISFAGDATHAPATTASRIRVARKVAINSVRMSAPAGSAVRIVASTSPPLVAGPSYLLGVAGDHWVTLGPHATTSAGTVVYTVTAPARGVTARYRVRIVGTAGFIDSYSAPIAVTGT